MKVPPIPGVTDRVDRQGGGPLDAMVRTTARQLIDQAITLLRKAARIDPMVSSKIANALAPLGASIPDDASEDDGEPTGARGLQAPSRNY